MATRRQVKIRTAANKNDNTVKQKRRTKPMELPPGLSNKHSKRGPGRAAIREILSSPILTPEEVATLYRVSPKTVMLMASDGVLPPLKMRSEVRFLRKDVLVCLRDMRDHDKLPEKFSRNKG